MNIIKGISSKKPTRKVIERYDGVAFDYLMYNKLDSNAQAYIDHNVIVFSNLFGPIRAGDKGIPDYKLKQGEKIEGFAVEKFYQEHFTPYLDDYLKEHPILDLRAGFYEKFYKPAKPYATLKFIKNGKVVSHFSKAYRGVILKEMALHAITSIESLINHTIENITLYDITEHKHKKEIIYHILE